MFWWMVSIKTLKRHMQDSVSICCMDKRKCVWDTDDCLANDIVKWADFSCFKFLSSLAPQRGGLQGVCGFWHFCRTSPSIPSVTSCLLAEPHIYVKEEVMTHLYGMCDYMLFVCLFVCLVLNRNFSLQSGKTKPTKMLFLISRTL